LSWFCCCNAIQNIKNADWSRNILEALLAQINELDSDLSQNLIVG
jgi:hypothetical protein